MILGPTASGKSRFAVSVARRLGGEILSVDALKVYRGLDIGTAKPEPDERDVVWHGIDLCESNEDWSVTRFLDYANPVIDDIVARGKLPILDATAPYYLKALLFGVDRGCPPDEDFRAQCEDIEAHKLHAQLMKEDPSAAQKIGPTNHRRLVRALEILQHTDRLASEPDDWGTLRDDYRWVMTGVMWEREKLYARVRERALAMFDAGWLDEVKAIEAGHGFSKPAANAHGYRRLREFINDECSLDEAKENTIKDVKTFARKCMTFFKSFPRVQWLNVNEVEDIDRAASYLAHELAVMMTEAELETPDVQLP